MRNIILTIIFLSAFFRVSGESMNKRLDLESSIEIHVELPAVPMRVAGEVRNGVPVWFVRLDDGRTLEIDPGSDTGYRIINQEKAEVLYQSDQWLLILIHTTKKD